MFKKRSKYAKSLPTNPYGYTIKIFKTFTITPRRHCAQTLTWPGLQPRSTSSPIIVHILIHTITLILTFSLSPPQTFEFLSCTVDMLARKSDSRNVYVLLCTRTPFMGISGSYDMFPKHLCFL